MNVALHALEHHFNHIYMVRETLGELLGRKTPLKAFIDSQKLFHVIEKDSRTTERSLQIDLRR